MEVDGDFNLNMLNIKCPWNIQLEWPTSWVIHGLEKRSGLEIRICHFRPSSCVSGEGNGTPRRESGSLCPYVGCVDSHTVVSLQEPRMFLRDEAHKSSPTECSPVHVVSPSPVSWVPEVRPSSEKTASEKRSPGTAFRPGWEKLFTGSKASEPPAEKKKPYCPWRSRLPECVKTDWCHTGLSSAIACSSELGLRPTWRRV